MKTLIITSLLLVLTVMGSKAGAQEWPDEYLGLPGDNLNLYATMKLFQESETLEGFERNLNDENSRINNLDLNGDNQVDYIMVLDYVDGDVHTIVLRAALSEDETQDVAVFTVQRFSNGSVEIQLIGDEALYGKNYIVEPIYNETPNPGYTGKNRSGRNITVVRTTTYEVAAWPVVRYIFLPDYVVWRSSWYWGYYPAYWNPWRPFYWHTYYGYHYNWHHHYYGHYRIWNHHRCHRYNDFYYSNVRVYSPRVSVKIKSGNYNHTYSRPDLRKQGEVLYARTNQGQSGRTRNSTTVRNERSNQSMSGSNRSVEARNPGGERRSATGVARSTSSGHTSTQGTVARKSASIESGRNAANSSSGKRTSVSGSERTSSGITVQSPSGSRGTNNTMKSGAVSNNRNVNRSSVNTTQSGTQRSSTTVSNRTAPKAQSSPESVRSRSFSVQNKSAVGSRSSSGQNKSTVGSRSSSGQTRSAVSAGGQRSSTRSASSKDSGSNSSSGSRSGR